MGMLVPGHAGVLHPGRWRRLRALGWMLALCLAAMLLYVGVRSGSLMAIGFALGERWTLAEDGPGGPQLVAEALAAAALLLAYAAAVRWGERRPATEVGIARMPAELAGGLVIGGLAIMATIWSQHAAGAVTMERQATHSALHAIALSIRSGVLEETLLRLIAFRLLWCATNAWIALALSALLFGLLRMLNPNASAFAAICIALEAGVLLAAFYVLTGRIWMSIGVHAGWNFTQGWVFGAAVSGTDDFTGGPWMTKPLPGVPSWLSGGEFGPEASLPALLICTALGLAVLGLAWSRGHMGAGHPAR